MRGIQPNQGSSAGQDLLFASPRLRQQGPYPVPAPEFSGRCQAVGPALDIPSWQGPSTQQHESALRIPSLGQTCGRCRVCQFPPVSSQSCFPQGEQLPHLEFVRFLR